MIETIEVNFQLAAQLVALGIEAAAIAIIAGGAVEAVVTFVRHLLVDRTTMSRRREIWLRFAAWIVLSLEFALGADVIRTAIAPSWDDIGKLGAIATIRTALNYFLTRDINEAVELGDSDAVKSGN